MLLCATSSKPKTTQPGRPHRRRFPFLSSCFPRRRHGLNFHYFRYKCTFPSQTTATYRPLSKNCITFFPALAIAAHRDFVSGFCSNPRRFFPAKRKSTCFKPRRGVLLIG